MSFDPALYLNRSSRTLGCVDCAADTPKEELTFTPELLYFHYVKPGSTSAAQPFIISNTGDLPVGIASLDASGDFDLTGPIPASLAPGESVEVNVVFKPTAEGVLTGDIMVDAGLTFDPQNCVHMVGIGGDPVTAEEVTDIVADYAALLLRVTALEALLAGFNPAAPLYSWRAYANSSNGRINFTTGAPSNHSFIGLAFNRQEPDPSQDPDDYEWSPIGSIVSDVVAYDVTNIAGVPSITIIENLTDLSTQLLAYQYDRQLLRDYVDALLYVDGEPVNTVIASFKNEVTTEVEAMAESLDIMGAKTPDGLSFLLDLEKVYVGPGLSMGTQLTNMFSYYQQNQASIQALSQTVAGLDYAEATDLALLGAKTVDGNAFQLNLATVRVSPTESLAQYINQTVAAAAGGAASVTEIHEAVIDPVAGASAKAVLQLDVNGYVTSMVATNNGTVSDITFVFDTFNIIHPGTLAPVFSVVGGVVKMTNVEIDTLKVGSVITESIATNAIRKSYSSELASNKLVPFAGSTTITSISATKDIAGSDIEVMWMVRMRPGCSYAGYFRLFESINGGAFNEIDQVWYWMPEVSLGGLRSNRSTEPYMRRFSGRPAGNIQYRLDFQFYAANNSNTGGHFEAGSGLRVEEIKR